MTASRAPSVAGGAVTVPRAAVTFGGAVTAAASGFALAVLVGRELGPASTGIYFSIVALSTMAYAVLKLGSDTAELWRIPRLLHAGRTHELRPTIGIGVSFPAAASLLAAAGVVLLADPLAQRLAGDVIPPEEVRVQLLWAAAALAFMPPTAILVAATRGLGQVAPFVLVQNIGLPLGRLIAVAAVLAAGASGVAVMAAWSLPVVIAFVAAAIMLRRAVRAVDHPRDRRRATEDGPGIAGEFWRFAGPRGVTSSMETVLVAVNVVVVGLLHGPAAAGIFGALTRFVTTGALAEQTVRILVAPRFSALLGAGDREAAARLYGMTTPWIVLVSWPVFLTLGAGAPAVLGIFGAEFTAGAGALVILSAAMCVTQLAGNVQTILLMSGRSGLQLANKLAAVVVLLALDLALIPRWGIAGAAVAWAASSLVDTALCFLEVRWMLEAPLRAPILPRLLLASAGAFVLPTALFVRVLDGGLLGLTVGLVVGAGAYLPLLWRWRRPLHLTAIATARTTEPVREPAPA